MRIAFFLFLLTCYLATTNATIKLLKAKIKSVPFAKYRAVKYVQQPVIISDPLPATFARPVSTYVSTYSVASPSVAAYTYTVPHTYESTYAVYAKPLTVTYNTSPIVHYAEHQPVYFEPHLVEEHYEDYKR